MLGMDEAEIRAAQRRQIHALLDELLDADEGADFGEGLLRYTKEHGRRIVAFRGWTSSHRLTGPPRDPGGRQIVPPPAA